MIYKRIALRWKERVSRITLETQKPKCIHEQSHVPGIGFCSYRGSEVPWHAICMLNTRELVCNSNWGWRSTRSRDNKSKSPRLKGGLSVGKAGLVSLLCKNSEFTIVPLPFVPVWGPQPWACAIYLPMFSRTHLLHPRFQTAELVFRNTFTDISWRYIVATLEPSLAKSNLTPEIYCFAILYDSVHLRARQVACLRSLPVRVSPSGLSQNSSM